MKLIADIDIQSPARKLTYEHSIFLIGSCFTEHIGGILAEHKFPVLQNPNGILFDPLSVCSNLQSYLQPKIYNEDDLFFINELWQSWQHHSVYSGVSQTEVLAKINASQYEAHTFLQRADWLIITLGSAFSYQLKNNDAPVANCHRAPGQWFIKHLCEVLEIINNLTETISQLNQFNSHLHIVLTISPVRHLRDGVINNNRSKARLIEAVHEVVTKFNNCIYFPAYELVIDILRDYRFFDIDLAHPNYAATEFVFEKFREAYIEKETQQLMEEIKQVVTAFKHKPFQPSTEAHKKFLHQALSKTQGLQHRLPHLDFNSLIEYFGSK